jgi:hypothetical protein
VIIRLKLLVLKMQMLLIFRRRKGIRQS